MKIKHKIFTFSILILSLTACLQSKNESLRLPNGVSLKNKVFFNPYNIPYLFNINNTFVYVLNEKTIDLINAKNMALTCFGGKNPNDVVEKYDFDFDKKGKILSYSFKKAPDVKNAYTSVKYEYNNDLVTKLIYERYMGQKANAYTNIIRKDGVMNLELHRNNTSNNIDVYSAGEQIQMVIDRIGDRIFSITYYVPTGNSLKSFIESQNSRLDVEAGKLEKCLKYAIYVDNGLPQVGYILGQNYTQENRVQQYSYDDDQRITKYEQWIGLDKITNIEFKYNSKYLPEIITYNERKYNIDFD